MALSKSLKKALKAGSFVVSLIIGIVWAVVDYALVWNPISFFIFACLFPQGMAEAFDRCKGRGFGPISLDFWPMLRQSICRWQIKWLPEAKKCWFVYRHQEEYSFDEQIDAYKEFACLSPMRAQTMLEKMSSDCRNYFCEHRASIFDKCKIIALKETFTAGDVKFILEVGSLDGLCNDIVNNIMHKMYGTKTPAQAFINLLIKCAAHNSLAADYLIVTTKRDGLTPESVENLMSMDDPALRDKVFDINARHGQVLLAHSCMSSVNYEDWQNFLKTKDVEIYSETETEMSVKMMELFYAAGYKLHPENILAFMAGKNAGSTDIANRYRRIIMANEPTLPPAVMEYIRGNASVYKLYLQVMSPKKES